jgi:hypothetical protein
MPVDNSASSSNKLAPLERVHLNAASFRSPSALFINIETENLQNIRTLIDSGSSDCFLDSHFTLSNNFILKNLSKPLHLLLFDGSTAANGIIIQYTTQNIHLPCGAQHPVRFLLTTLDHSASAVLGYSWLHRHNPSIDWVTHEITFRTANAGNQPVDTSRSTSSRALPELSASSSNPAIAGSPNASLAPDLAPSAKLRAAMAAILISFIRASVLAFLTRLPSSHSQSITLSGIIKPDSLSARATNPIADTALAAEYADLRLQVPTEYYDYLDIFSKRKGTTLPPRRHHDHCIDLMDNLSPPFGPIYSLSEVEQLALREFLDENLSNHFIRPSQSSASVPILFIKKKDGSLCLAVNYCGLNKITKKDQYPLPLIPDLLDRLRSAHTFTKLDLRGAYNLVRIADGDEWKTAFRTRYGSYEFQVMHYSLTNAPMSFQHFMNEVFKDLLDMCVVVYLDDILIYSDDPAEHLNHVREVLRRLREHSLFAKVEKCAFSMDTTDFLGFIISPDGLRMDESKVQVIHDWPTPRKVKDIQSFLGFANFYHQFIASYSEITVPLTRLTRKDAHWVWSPQCEAAFQLLKTAFTMAPILHHFDPSLPPVIEMDASDYAITGILSLRTEDGEVHPVAFFSRTLTGAELNYDTHDKELLAVFDTFKTWQHYLESPHHVIDVITDHKNLEYFSSTKMLTHRQA